MPGRFSNTYGYITANPNEFLDCDYEVRSTGNIELIQNNSVRFILRNYNRTPSVSAMKTNLSLNLLSSHRKISRLVLFHKLYHHSTLRNDFIFQPQYVSPRIDHRYKVGLESCHTKTFLQPSFSRSSTEWNHLPDEIVSIHDNQRFRASLANIV